MRIHRSDDELENAAARGWQRAAALGGKRVLVPVAQFERGH